MTTQGSKGCLLLLQFGWESVGMTDGGDFRHFQLGFSPGKL